MKQKIEDTHLRKSRPVGTEIWDTQTQGLIAKWWRTGITFSLRYKFDGRRRRLSLGKYPVISLAEARLRAMEALVQVARGEDPQEVAKAAEPAAILTFGDLRARYLEDVDRRELATAKEIRRLLTVYPPKAWAGRPAVSITPNELKELFRDLTVKRGGTTANRVRSWLRAMYAFGDDHLNLIKDNPVSRTKKPAKDKARDRVLSFNEIRILWNVCADHRSDAADCIRLLLLTGCRMREVLLARWAQVEGNWLDLPKTKTGPHRVYLSEPARAILMARKAFAISDFIFPSPENPSQPIFDIKTSKRTIARKASLNTHWQVRDLRTTFATQSARIGVPPQIVSVCLNHSLVGVPGTAAPITKRNYIIGKEMYFDDAQQGWIAWGSQVLRLANSDSDTVFSLEDDNSKPWANTFLSSSV